MKTSFIQRAGVITAASIIAASGTTAQAQDTWDGGGIDDNFSTGNNWVDNTAPNNVAAGALTFDGVARLTPNADLTYSGITSLTFAAGAGAFVIGGLDLSFTGGAAITNSSTNIQQINNNLIIADTGLTLDSSTANLVINGATLDNGGFNITVQGASATTINSNISGTGGLTMNGPGVLALFGANTYTGATSVTAGTLDLNGSLTGSALTVSGGGTLNLTGTVGGASTITLTSGTYNISGTGAITTSADTTMAAGTLTFSGTGDLGGTGNFIINGGTVDLAAGTTISTTGTTTLTGGSSMIVNGIISGVVNNGATITGAGTITGNYTGQAGSNTNAATAGTIGTLTFGNDFTLNATATLAVDISKTAGGAITNDQIAVGNNAVFDANSTIALNDLAAGGTWLPGDTLVIANATTGSTDSGLLVTDSFAFLNFNVVINGTDLNLVAAGVFAPAANTPNNVALGTALDIDAQTAGGTFLTYLTALNALGAGAPINNAMQASSPLVHASIADSNLRVLQHQARVNADYLRGRRQGTQSQLGAAPQQSDMQFASAATDPTTLAMAIRQAQSGEQGSPSGNSTNTGEKNWNVYANLFGVFSDDDTRAGFGGYSANSFGGQIGVDTTLDSGLIVGILVGLSNSQIDFNTGGDADVDSFRIGPYLSWEPKKNLILDASVTYGQHSNDVSRIVSFTGFTGTATSDFDAQDVSVYASLGYDIEENDFTYTPFVSLNYTYYDSDSYIEAGGGGAALAVDSRQLQSLQSTLGIRANTIYKGNGSMTLIPEAYLAWGSELLDEDSIEAKFVGGATRFSTDPDHSDNSFLFGAGTSVLISDTVSVFIRYDGEVSDDGQLNAISGGVNIRF